MNLTNDKSNNASVDVRGSSTVQARTGAISVTEMFLVRESHRLGGVGSARARVHRSLLSNNSKRSIAERLNQRSVVFRLPISPLVIHSSSFRPLAGRTPFKPMNVQAVKKRRTRNNESFTRSVDQAYDQESDLSDKENQRP